jgi:hypothetical protein
MAGRLLMKLRQLYGRVIIQLRLKNKVVGWAMTPSDATEFIKSMGKTVVTFFGYSSMYEDEKAMLEIVQKVLSEYSPETTLVNIGVTRNGIGAAYSVAKSMRFTTTGIASTLALEAIGDISRDVDHICFIADDQWGGKLPNSETLSPTSHAMVVCSDMLIGIGGDKISRDEMLFGREQGKRIIFYPADNNHVWLIRRAQKLGLPKPKSFRGAAYEVFGKKNDQ